MASQIYTGARAIFKVQGAQVAIATGVDVSETINYEPIRVLNDLAVVEHAEISYDCSVRCEVVKVVGQALKQIGLFPYFMNILTQPDLTIEIVDSVTNNTIIDTIYGVKPNTASYSVKAGQAVIQDLTFVAIRVQNVSEPNPTNQIYF